MTTAMREYGENIGLVTCPEVASNLVRDLTKNGLFTKIFPLTEWDGQGHCIIEPTNQVDAIFVQPNMPLGVMPTSWRIAFTVEEQKIICNVATSLQLQDDGTIARATWDAESKNPGEFVLVDRSHLDALGEPIYPMTYNYSISDHGLFVGVWDQSTDEYQDENNYISPAFRWFVVQRPVAFDNGDVFNSGHAPVFCVYTTIEKGFVQLRDSQLPNLAPPPSTSTGGSNPTPTPSNKVYDIEINGTYFRQATAQFHRKFVVRESDIFRPSITKPADMNSEDGNAILNSTYQVSIAEDHRYVLTIPKGLNTSRFSYTQELDMIAFSSADVVGHTSVIDVPTYGTTYRYKAMPSNRTRNTGMRIFCRTNLDTTP